MHLRVISVGRSMPGWLQAGWQEYAKRLPAPFKLELVEVTTSRGATSRREAEALLARCPKRAIRVALDERGELWSTVQFATHMARWRESGRPVCLLIGGADGHDPWLLEQVEYRWSLSPLTFPHQLVRVIVAEQCYRAWSVLAGHPYHRE